MEINSTRYMHYKFILFQKCLKQTQQWLKKGALTEEKVFDNLTKILSIFRDCNVTLRWFVMHTAHHHSGIV